MGVIFFWLILRFVVALRLAGAVFALVRPDKTTEEHTPFHPRIAGQIVDMRAFTILFMRASTGAHELFSLLLNMLNMDGGDREFNKINGVFGIRLTHADGAGSLQGYFLAIDAYHVAAAETDISSVGTLINKKKFAEA